MSVSCIAPSTSHKFQYLVLHDLGRHRAICFSFLGIWYEEGEIYLARSYFVVNSFPGTSDPLFILVDFCCSFPSYFQYKTLITTSFAWESLRYWHELSMHFWEFIFYGLLKWLLRKDAPITAVLLNLSGVYLGPLLCIIVLDYPICKSEVIPRDGCRYRRSLSPFQNDAFLEPCGSSDIFI